MDETFNKFLVSAAGNAIVILNPAALQPMNKDEAINLAAWLVAVSGERAEFNRLLELIKET